MQRCLTEQNFNQHNLAQQIDAAKKNNTIPKRYHKLADEIRKYGNIGAHPDDDHLETVNEANATQLLKFVDLLIQEFYVLPAKAKALEQQRNEAKS